MNKKLLGIKNYIKKKELYEFRVAKNRSFSLLISYNF